ncbi:ABC-F family ATP-binding cassette domain-containing protein [Paenibacillus spiritus]|uniref:ABC-F family ATP-binding cassette domain-containing protein n=1 Tax=Paenibacillus spiritus TaxID=2496557 RepID=A0A5J5FZT0_9BACL|nr:ABC-F family ATP-binding cassette domain-containing protein [Paenibacillus spiritus]KAA8999811.1 ABC-F family ATP-binding cassette domain-containing protein [Paenibacillus spiritus]
MNILTVEHLTKSYGEKVLFQDASFGMDERDKVGVIGVNGTGKSTLLRIIAGVEKADEGTIAIGNSIRVQVVTQNPAYDPDATVLQQVLSGDDPGLAGMRRYTELADRLAADPGNAALEAKLAAAGHEVDAAGAWSLESEAKAVLGKLGITGFDARMGTLSGGQRKRVALAAALITPSELLILDEPTNHIDTGSVAWLEQYLQKRRGALLMVTHDRYFLERVCGVMLELDQGRMFRYEANYSRFLELKADREEREAAEEQKRRNLLRSELAWVRRGAKARTTKQKARLDRFEQLKAQTGQSSGPSLEMSAASTRLGRKILELDGLTKSVGGRTLIRDLSYIAVPFDRVGIVGPNGSGKSTLLNLIAGRLAPDSGVVELGPTVKLGYFMQEHQDMDENLRVIEYIKEEAEVVRTADGSAITAAQMLERFLFPPAMQWTPISRLSGGEKRRLYLLRVLMGAPNVLLLDEPTNDLDIGTLAILEDYLDGFPGVVFTVSHDRFFLDRTVDKILAFEEGGIRVHVGDYSEYEEWLAENVPASGAAGQSPARSGNAGASTGGKAESAPSSSRTSPSAKEKVKFTFKEQKEYEVIDRLVEQAEQRIAEVAAAMEAAFADSARLQELMKEQAEAEAELERLMERWTYLNELAERIAAQ